MLLLTLAALALAGQALSALAVWFNHRHTPPLDPVPGGAAAPDPGGAAVPDLLCLVPARDEERNIVPCVGSLAASVYPGRLRIRVMDDGSTDGTAALVRRLAAEDARVELGPVEPPPPGWLGKNHALAEGARDAREPWILFADADVRVAPDCLARAVATAVRTEADLLTLVPRVEARSFWERAVQPLVAALVYAWLPARDINDPRRPPAAAIGPFMLFRRVAYERVGGHTAVRAEVVEDRALAEAVKRAGQRLLLARGVEVASLRMYDSLAAIVRGWSKNFHLALGSAAWLAPLAAAALLTVYAGPYLLPLLAMAAHARPALAVALAATALALAARLDLARRYGVTARSAWLAPLGAAVVALILVRSALPLPVEWKGRRVK